MNPLLQASRLSVRFGSTTALNEVDFDLESGEVHAVIGENGAGKSTLIRCLVGALSPSGGSVTRAATTQVAWVPQEPLLPPDLSVGEWIFLGEEWRGPLRLLDKRRMNLAAREALGEAGAILAPAQRLGTLNAPQRKQVQLARAIRQRAEVLLLDEPTAVLGASETAALFECIKSQRQRGGAVLYVSHRLDEIRAIAERVSVLRDGQLVATAAVADTTTTRLVELMVGRALMPRAVGRREKGDIVLRVDQLRVAQVCDASFAVHAGEIVGIAGLMGSGRSEIVETIAGIRKLDGGTVKCARPIALLAEDRGHKGLVAPLDLRNNIFLPAPTGWLRNGVERREATEWIQQLRIRAEGPESAVSSLSGGNQQKVLLARALRQSPKLLLLDEPTAGVDVGAKAEIHELILDRANRGMGVLMVSSDMPELLGLCDRILALYGGRCVGTFDAASTSEAALAAHITGAA